MAGGRPPEGPRIVRKLEGSAHAQKRLETILETVSGAMSVGDACGGLGVGETAFHRMRTGALAAALASLEPKPLGRRPKIADEKDRRIAELEAEIDRLRKVVAASQVREELALAMPFLAERRKSREAMDDGRGEKKGGRRAGPSVDGHDSDQAEGGPGEPQGAQARREDEGGDGGQGDAR
jgi:hypothetical protein